MIKYNTSDLIRRAEQLADLENSDFISWNENIMAINEAYQSVYQKAINRGEQYYLKCCDLGSIGLLGDEVCYALPSDFYQLYSLNVKESGMSIPRKTINGSRHTLCYDIVNNQLVIYGSCSGVLELKYYPEPKALTYKGKDVQFDNVHVEDKQIIDVYNTTVVYKEDDSFLVAMDLDGDRNERFSGTFKNFNGIIACKGGAVLVNFDNPYGRSYFDFTKKNFIDGYFNFLTSDKEALRWDDSRQGFVSTNEVMVYPATKKFNDFTLTFNDFNMLYGCLDIENNECIIVHPRELTATEIGELYRYSFKTDTYELLYKYDEDSVYREEIPCYILAKNGMILQKGFFRKYVSDVISNKIILDNAIGINKIDGNTGYGVTNINGVISSVFSDTQLDYPNNFFLNMLSYKLAIFYKAKQGGDTNSLMLLYQQAEDQFYDSLPRDDYSPVRIQNVY